MVNLVLLDMRVKHCQKHAHVYSVTELEMTGFLINMGLWKNILKHREFDASSGPCCCNTDFEGQNRTSIQQNYEIARSLKCIYSFNLYYLKGKDMILADYLSRNCNEDEDPTDLIPVSFCKIRDIEDFCVATRASVKASGETWYLKSMGWTKN